MENNDFGPLRHEVCYRKFSTPISKKVDLALKKSSQRKCKILIRSILKKLRSVILAPLVTRLLAEIFSNLIYKIDKLEMETESLFRGCDLREIAQS